MLPDLGGSRLDELTPEIVRRWRDGLARQTVSRGLTRLKKNRKARIQEHAESLDAGQQADVQRKKQATANRIFNSFRACLNYAWRDGKVTSDHAWRRVPAFRNVDAPVIRFLTGDEALRLVNASDPDFRPMIRAALFTGCRYGELCALRVGDYDPENDTLVIRTSKSGRPRHIYLSEEGVEFFDELTVGRPRDALLLTHADGSRLGGVTSTPRDA